MTWKEKAILESLQMIYDRFIANPVKNGQHVQLEIQACFAKFIFIYLLYLPNYFTFQCLFVISVDCGTMDEIDTFLYLRSLKNI